MLRTAVARSVRCAEQGWGRQWQLQLVRPPLKVSNTAPGLDEQALKHDILTCELQRTFVDARPADKTVLPGSQSTTTTAGVPQPPILTTATINPTQSDALAAQPPPPLPPSPEEVQAATPAPSTNTGNLPPTGTGTAATGPTSAPPPPPRRPRRRFRNFLLSLIVLSTLGYAGGVYYSLVSDNFHDFFTEYVPYGEDAVAYFEEREFRKRFPVKEMAAKVWPQTRGENKITIGRSSGLSPKVADTEDLGKGGRHTSALDDSKPRPAPQKKSSDASVAKKDNTSKAAPAPAPANATAAAGPTIDHINAPGASEPVVQDLIKMVNNIITAVNASPEATKFSSVVNNLKGDLNNVIAEIGTLKEQHAHAADAKIKDAHTEFDTAAQELVRRLEQEMREQESKWREEYESEREKLSNSYQQKLAAELDAAKKIAEEQNKNSLLQQEIALQKQYMDTVKSKVEEERSGRLSKLDELSTSVSELEKLTSEWNSVVDATLQVQHLQVALEAVKAKVLDSDVPSPFLNELVAVKELSKDDEVVNAAIASINPIAYQRGVPSPAHLIDRFRRVATEVRKASLLPEDAGIASHAASAVLSKFMFQKRSERGLPEGDDVEATLARTEVLLEEGDLDAAAREMNGLQGWAGVLSKDWVGECRRVLEVRQAVDVISVEARLQSLLVE
nr:MICOS complex subunit MIC60-like [Quercus suber]